VIFNIPVFAFPNYIVIAAQLLGVPHLLLTPHDARYPGLTGLLAAGGALNQIDTPHERLWIDLDEPDSVDQIYTFARAARAVSRLRGQVYGLIGGRSIGMGTGAAPAELWQQKFGVDVDHVDQSEVLRLADLVPADEVQKAKRWLEEHVREIVYDGEQLTPEKFDFQLRCYIALKEIVTQYQFDFAGIKCHFDMSEFFSVQCMSAAFLNDPYDWNGPKEPVPLACEADSDGALTMQILKLISSKPPSLLDLRFYDQNKQVYVMPNCGSAPTWFAARSDDPAENLARVSLVPSISKYAGGGAHVRFVFKGGDLTLARLTRSPEGYQLVIARAESVEFPLPDVKGTTDRWPHAFVRLDVPPKKLIHTLQANHLHGVAGDYQEELLTFARLLGIKTVVLGQGTSFVAGENAGVA
jgi:L-fucose isomerase